MESETAEASQDVKPSRWWVVYHVWAGICLNQVATLSGFYSKLLPRPWLESVTLESTEAFKDSVATKITFFGTVIMLVLVGIGYVASKSLLAAIDRGKDSPRKKRAVKWVLPIAYPVVAGLAASWIGPFVDTAARSNLSVHAPPVGSASSTYRLASPSVALIRTYAQLVRESNGNLAVERSEQPILQGSGVVIDNGLVISNCHVLMAGGFWTVTIGGHEYTDGKLSEMDPERDLCTLKVSNLSAAPARAASERAIIGQRVFSIGAPKGLDLTIGEGIISALRQDSGGTILQTTAPISPGSSGGGLFDERGELLGITAFRYVEGENLNFALPVSWITDLPDRSQKYRAIRAQGVQYGESCLTANRRDEYGHARQIGEKWTKVDPFSASAWQCLGEAATGQADFVTAFASLEKAVELEPGPSALVALGFAHMDRDGRSRVGLSASSARIRNADEEAAEVALKRAITIDPQYGDAWERQAQLYDLTGRFEDAFASAERATNIDPNSVFAWDELAGACLSLKKIDCAISAAKRATTLGPGDLNAWGTLRLAAQAVGDSKLEASAERTMKVLAESIRWKAAGPDKPMQSD
jgi:S1-C subfamily serine protease/cytochrome c-type biogenesis protein CcmH/NrfG